MAVRPYKQNDKSRPLSWMIDFYNSQKKRDRTIYIGSRAEAEAHESDLRKQHTSGPLVNPPINRILPEYLTWMRNHRAENTVKDIEWSLKKIQPHFCHYPVNRITRRLIEDYIAKRKTAGRISAQGKRLGELKASGINKELAYLSSIISWMVDQGYSYPLPFKIPKLKHRRRLPRIPAHSEIEAFIAALGDEIGASGKPKKGADRKKLILAAVIYDHGLRWSEATHLKWQDIAWANGVIIIVGKGDKERTVLLSDRCRKLLAEHRQKAGGNLAAGLIFANPKTGRPYGTQQKAWKRAGQSAGVKINPHLLRHAFATYTLEATGDLRVVQTELGHSSIAMSEIYTHISHSRRREVGKKRQEYLKNSLKNEKE